MKYLLVIICILLLTSCGDMEIHEAGEGAGIESASTKSSLYDEIVQEASDGEEFADAVLPDDKTNDEASHEEDNQISIARFSDFIQSKPDGYDGYCLLEGVDIGKHTNVTIVADIMPKLESSPYFNLYFYIFDTAGDLLIQTQYSVEGLRFHRVSSIVAYDINSDGFNDLVFSACGIGGNSTHEWYFGGAFLADNGDLYLDEALNHDWIWWLPQEEACDIDSVVRKAEEYFTDRESFEPSENIINDSNTQNISDALISIMSIFIDAEYQEHPEIHLFEDSLVEVSYVQENMWHDRPYTQLLEASSKGITCFLRIPSSTSIETVKYSTTFYIIVLGMKPDGTYFTDCYDFYLTGVASLSDFFDYKIDGRRWDDEIITFTFFFPSVTEQ